MTTETKEPKGKKPWSPLDILWGIAAFTGHADDLDAIQNWVIGIFSGGCGCGCAALILVPLTALCCWGFLWIQALSGQ